MEEEEKYHTPVEEAKSTTADKVEAEDTITLVQSELLIEDYATLLVPPCSTMAISRHQTKPDHLGRNSYNKLARITDKT